MPQRRSCAETQRKFKATANSRYSRNSSQLILSITRRSLEQLQTRRRAEALHYMHQAFPDFHAEIHWQLADGDREGEATVLCLPDAPLDAAHRSVAPD